MEEGGVNMEKRVKNELGKYPSRKHEYKYIILDKTLNVQIN